MSSFDFLDTEDDYNNTDEPSLYEDEFEELKQAAFDFDDEDDIVSVAQPSISQEEDCENGTINSKTNHLVNSSINQPFQSDSHCNRDREGDSGEIEEEYQLSSFVVYFVEENRSKWKRSNPEDEESIYKQAPSKRSQYMMVTSIDNVVLYETGIPKTLIRFYGLTESGNSVMVISDDFKTYFHIKKRCFRDFFGSLDDFKEVLNTNLLNLHKSMSKTSRYIHKVYPIIQDIELVAELMDMNGYCKYKEPFYKITLSSTSDMQLCRNYFKQKSITTYESDVIPVMKCSIDRGISGAQWVEVSDFWVAGELQDGRVSKCQHEWYTATKNIKPMDISDPKWSKIAPLRTLAFDIECITAGTAIHFPNAKLGDPIVMISNYVYELGSDDPVHENIFIVGDCDEIPSYTKNVYSFETETQLLEGWIKFVTITDPDIFTGYNFVNFDLPFIFNRANSLGIKIIHEIGRLAKNTLKMKQMTIGSKQIGIREVKDIPIPGVIQMDAMTCMIRSEKLSSYTLNAVSAHLLGDQKEGVHHSVIKQLALGSSTDRARLAKYCMKDSKLVYEIIVKKQFIIEMVEMARVTGVPMDWVHSKGQQVRVTSCILRFCKSKGLLMPTLNVKPTFGKFKGAKVLDPKKGCYRWCVTTLDFASLYPSIMIAYNLCYTTLLSRETIALYNLKSDTDYIVTPNGYFFATPDLKKGLLPEILVFLIGKRKQVRGELGKLDDKDPRCKILNGRQLAIKIVANSIYGYTGAKTAPIPCVAISSSVTAFGQKLIVQAKDFIEKTYTIKNGYKCNADVIYGDTDSVMIYMENYTIAEALALGPKMSKEVSENFPRPLVMEFEKTFAPDCEGVDSKGGCGFILLAKKKYVGNKFEVKSGPYKAAKMVDPKGIEMVRRDNCEFLRETQEGMLNWILKKHDIEGAVKFVESQIADLLDGLVDTSKLLFTGNYAKSVETYDKKLAHIELIKRMIAEDKESAPRVGDRIIFTYKRSHSKAVSHEKAETIMRIVDNDFQVDFEHIYGKKVINPLRSILEVVLEDNEKCDRIFTGAHTKRTHGTKISDNSTFGLTKFFKKVDICYVCKNKLNSDENHVCKGCIAENSKIQTWFESKSARLDKFNSKNEGCWGECLKCQVGDVIAVKECSNGECPTFLSRLTIGKELSTLSKELNGCKSVMKNKSDDIEDLFVDPIVQPIKGVVRPLETPQNPPQKKQKGFSISNWLIKDVAQRSESTGPTNTNVVREEVIELQDESALDENLMTSNSQKKHKAGTFTFSDWTKSKKKK